MRAALLAAAALAAGGCAVNQNADQPSAPREPGSIVGVGGVFFRAGDGAALQKWYGEHLGLPTNTQGYAQLPWLDPRTGDYYSTTWGPFKRDTTYFDADQQYMVNYVVNDLDAALEKLRAAGARIADERMDEPYGRFAWFWDPEGIKVELWEPDREFMKKAQERGGEWTD